MRSGPFGGLLLAMDTSGKVGSVAVGAAAEVLARTFLEAEEEHAALLVPRIREVLEEVGADMEELAGIVVGAGPGSFTGVRVAAATAKGMARALSVPLWAFSSLAAAAVAPEARDREGWGPNPRFVLFDARSDRVYAAGYQLAPSGALETLLAPTATTIGELLEGTLSPGALVLGEGAWRHRATLEGAGLVVLPPPAGLPTADGLLRLLALDPGARPVDDPARWEPDYLRASGAEQMWTTRRKGSL